MSPSASALVAKNSGGMTSGVVARMTLPARRICSAKKLSDSIRLPSAICTGGWSGRKSRTRCRKRWLFRLARKVPRRAVRRSDAAIKSVTVAELAALNRRDARLVNRNNGKVGGNRRGKIQGRFCAQVISHPFQALEKIKLPHPYNADERQREDGHENRRVLKGLQLHRAELNKKTRATQGCSGHKLTTNRKRNKIRSEVKICRKWARRELSRHYPRKPSDLKK